jgi:hypothetical protein
MKAESHVFHRESKVEVWSDTLLPDSSNLASTIQQVYIMNNSERDRKKKKRSNTDTGFRIVTTTSVDDSEQFWVGGRETTPPLHPSPSGSPRSSRPLVPSITSSPEATIPSDASPTRRDPANRPKEAILPDKPGQRSPGSSRQPAHSRRVTEPNLCRALTTPAPPRKPLDIVEAAGLMYLER